MIIIIFRAKIQPGKLTEWQDKVEKLSIPWLKSQHGLLGHYPGKPLVSDAREFCMIMLWKDLDSLKEAVGEDITQVVLREDEATLVEESSVDHYELFGSTELQRHLE
ncbi:MAG: antibiotic biosynthesis monooxygenase family protein [Nitrospinales bacterium]